MVMQRQVGSTSGEMKVELLGKFDLQKPAVVPFPIMKACAGRGYTGFASPAEEFDEPRLDFNELIVNPEFTYAMRAHGPSLQDKGILDGAILAVDARIPEMDGSIVIANVNGDMVVKVLAIDDHKRYFLHSANDDLDIAPIEITNDIDFHKWGVVIFALNICHPTVAHRARGL